MIKSLTNDILNRTFEMQKVLFKSKKDIEEISKKISEKILSEGRIIFIGVGYCPEITKSIIKELWFNFQIDKSKFLSLTAAKGFASVIENWKELENLSSVSIFELDEIGLNNTDLIIGLSTSGISDYISSSLKYAKELGCETAVITNTSNLKTLKYIDYKIDTKFSNPTINGLSSAEGGTIQKIIIDLLIYNAMQYSGRIYKNNLVYIIPISNKLEEYSISIIMDILKINKDKAKILFKLNKKSTEITLITEIKKITSIEAKILIKKYNYDFNKILQ